MINRHLVNSTLKAYWISSGSTPSLITFSVKDGSENIVSSGSGVNSGNGHFYRFFSVNTLGYFAGEWRATISGLQYRRKFKFKATEEEVD